MMGDGCHAEPEAALDGGLSDSYMEGTRTTPEERNQVTWLSDVEDVDHGIVSLP